MGQGEGMDGSCEGNLLEVRDLSLTLGGNNILRDINMDVGHGRIHALIGPNGAGKTTLIRAIMGGMPHKGTVRFHFCDNGRIGYVPQLLEFDHSVPMTVFDFLFLMLRRTPLFLSRRKPMRDEILKILSATRCEQLIDRMVGYLSGGEFRRVLLAQALVPKPELLLLDEPASNVDEGGARQFERMLIDLKEQQGHSILMVSHDMQTILRIADHVTAINRTVTYDGSPDNLSLSDLFVNVQPEVSPMVAQ
ncbi:MAG: metal ABC transporter ATP-binding protein [Candidatus Marinimicrobia bacterium]|nr:metal ABC transporter ATP-binding protein [Candidatus Neomarinimicrobiota bacterium]